MLKKIVVVDVFLKLELIQRMLELIPIPILRTIHGIAMGSC